MKITLTLQEIMNRGKWDAYCALMGLNPWFVNEGLGSMTDEVTLTYEQLSFLGMAQGLDHVEKIEM